MNLRKNDEKTLRVAIALDESSSMGWMLKDTLTGLNEQLDELRKGKVKKGVNSRVTLVTFSGHDSIEERFVDTPIDEIPVITQEHYDPSGMTAMYDGVARAINLLRAQDDDDETTFMLIILTDGQENNSKEHTAQRVADMIKEVEATGKWTISYMGANQDLREVQADLGLEASNIATYTATAKGTRSAFRKMSDSTAHYLSARSVMPAGQSAYIQDFGLDKNFYNKGGDDIDTVDEDYVDQVIIPGMNTSTGDSIPDPSYTISNDVDTSDDDGDDD